MAEGTLKELMGVYRGFSPTDESALCIGEIELVVGEDTIKIRMATGLKIEEKEIKTDDFSLAAKEVIALMFAEGIDLSKVSVFECTASSTGYPKLIFMNDVDAGMSLRLDTGGMGEMLGPTILFGPKQLEKGLFEESLSRIEKAAELGVGVIPRLRNKGRAEE